MARYLMISLARYGAYHRGGRLSSRLARRRRPATRQGPKPGYNHRLNPATWRQTDQRPYDAQF